MTDGNALGVSDERRREIAAFNLETDEKICKPNDTKEIHSDRGETIFEVGNCAKFIRPLTACPHIFFMESHSNDFNRFAPRKLITIE